MIITHRTAWRRCETRRRRSSGGFYDSWLFPFFEVNPIGRLTRVASEGKNPMICDSCTQDRKSKVRRCFQWTTLSLKRTAHMVAEKYFLLTEFWSEWIYRKALRCRRKAVALWNCKSYPHKARVSIVLAPFGLFSFSTLMPRNVECKTFCPHGGSNGNA